MNTLSHVPTLAALTEQLAAEGFLPGAPPHITSQSQSIDAQVCRCLSCPNCGRRGLTYRPFQRGTDYAVFAECARCGHAEEV